MYILRFCSGSLIVGAFRQFWRVEKDDWTSRQSFPSFFESHVFKIRAATNVYFCHRLKCKMFCQLIGHEVQQIQKIMITIGVEQVHLTLALSLCISIISTARKSCLSPMLSWSKSSPATTISHNHNNTERKSFECAPHSFYTQVCLGSQHWFRDQWVWEL